MDQIFIDIRKEGENISKYFTTDYVSIDAILNLISDLDYQVEHLREQLHDKNFDDAYQNWLSEQADLINDERRMKDE